jgi:outer membrane receptor protein involved in Fe transport
VGADIGLGEHILLQPSIFYSKGTDFQYFVGTGDSIYSGNKPKPVLRRENIGNIQIFGQEIGLRVQVTRNLVFLANYAHYDSEIIKFALTGYVAKDLTGKQLMEVAPNQFNASLTWKSRLISAGVFYHYTDSQFIDDENTISSPSHSILDVKLYRDFNRHINMNLGIQNILNTSYIDEKGQQSIGRFIMFGAAYTF